MERKIERVLVFEDLIWDWLPPRHDFRANPPAGEFWHALESRQVRGYVAPSCLGRVRAFIVSYYGATSVEAELSRLQKIVEECPAGSIQDLLDCNLKPIEAEAVACARMMNLDAIVAGHADHLCEQDLVPVKAVEVFVKDLQLAATPLVPLSQWFEAIEREVANTIVAAGWLLYEEVFGSRKVDYGLRVPILTPDLKTGANVVRRVKTIDLRTEEASCPVVLVINMTKETNPNTTSILPQLRPLQSNDETIYLPEGAQLIVLDESGKPFDRAEAGKDSMLLQLDDWFGDEPGTKFSIKVVLGKATFTESFWI